MNYERIVSNGSHRWLSHFECMQHFRKIISSIKPKKTVGNLLHKDHTIIQKRTPLSTLILIQIHTLNSEVSPMQLLSLGDGGKGVDVVVSTLNHNEPDLTKIDPTYLCVQLEYYILILLFFFNFFHVNNNSYSLYQIV